MQWKNQQVADPDVGNQLAGHQLQFGKDPNDAPKAYSIRAFRGRTSVTATSVPFTQNFKAKLVNSTPMPATPPRRKYNTSARCRAACG